MKSRDRILHAAVDVFAARGKYGARMEEIASQAGVNKAMLYYYYSSKENLFREVLMFIFSRNFSELINGFEQVVSTTRNFSQRVEALSHLYFNIFSNHVSSTRITLEALAGDPGEVRQVIRALFSESDLIHPEKVFRIFEEGISRGQCRDIDPRQAVISIIGMNLIYFLNGPMAEVILDLDGEDREIFLRERRQSVVDLLLNGVVKSPTPDNPNGGFDGPAG